MCLAQGHTVVTPVRREPAVPRFRVKHFTTEPLCSHKFIMKCVKHNDTFFSIQGSCQHVHVDVKYFIKQMAIFILHQSCMGSFDVFSY